MTFPILSWLIWLPVFSGIAALILSRLNLGRALLLGVSLPAAAAAFAISLVLFDAFDRSTADMQFVEEEIWILSANIHYSLGVDGISLLMILLNNFTTLLVVVGAVGARHQRPGQYLAAFLIMSGLVNGVFCALDAILFYIFWEATLIPLFLAIGIWGGPRRLYAAIKFFLYTLIGSLLMLVAFIYLYLTEGTFDIPALHAAPIGLVPQIFIFLAFFAAFAVKVPMVPVHTWLPDAHVEAPTGGSIVLAAVMLKLGAYGFLRFSLPIAPDASEFFSVYVIGLSVVAIIYIGLVALVQEDMKKLVAYSSVAHMGFVTLGFFLFTDWGLTGGLYQMVSHGFVSGALFYCVGVIYDRMHTRRISDYGGVANTMPRYATLLMLFAMANAGLPGTSGFVGEFMVVLGALQVNFLAGVLAATALITGAAYSLWMYKRVIFGEVANEAVGALKDVTPKEMAILLAFAAAVLLFGLWPFPFTETMQASVANLVEHVEAGKL